MSQEVTTLFRYNGKEYEFDIRDADNAERFEDAARRMEEEEQALPKTGKLSDLYRGQCRMLKRFFDRVLGDGAGTAICTEKDNISVHYEAYVALCRLVNQQKDELLSRKNTFSKYSNRSQRRASHSQHKTADYANKKKKWRA